MRPTPIAHHQPPEGVQGEHPQGERSERPTNAGKAGPGVPAASGKRNARFVSGWWIAVAVILTIVGVLFGLAVYVAAGGL